MKAEYRGMIVAMCEAIWLKRLLKNLQVEVSDRNDQDQQPQQHPVSKAPIFHAWTKHIEVHYHFIHERVLSGEGELVYVLRDRQNADIFTKPLGLEKLQQFSGALHL